MKSPTVEKLTDSHLNEAIANNISANKFPQATRVLTSNCLLYRFVGGVVVVVTTFVMCFQQPEDTLP